MCSQKFDLQVRFITPLHAFARVDACTCDSTHLLKESADTCARAHARAHTHTHTHTHGVRSNSPFQKILHTY